MTQGFTIKDTYKDEVEVFSGHRRVYVALSTPGGSPRPFDMSFTPKQARKLAKALLSIAAEVESS